MRRCVTSVLAIALVAVAQPTICDTYAPKAPSEHPSHHHRHH